jgi:hypothetical protein
LLEVVLRVLDKNLQLKGRLTDDIRTPLRDEEVALVRIRSLGAYDGLEPRARGAMSGR